MGKIFYCEGSRASSENSFKGINCKFVILWQPSLGKFLVAPNHGITFRRQNSLYSVLWEWRRTYSNWHKILLFLSSSTMYLSLQQMNIKIFRNSAQNKMKLHKCTAHPLQSLMSCMIGIINVNSNDIKARFVITFTRQILFSQLR
jgi:hypothetical protein